MKTKGRINFSLIIVVAYLIIFGMLGFYFFKPLEKLQVFHDIQRKNDIASIQKALEAYYHYHGRYPPNPAMGDYRIIGPDGQAILWGDQWPAYMDHVPKDPGFPDRTYVYIASDGYGQTYYLYASLERGTLDKDACNKGAACTSVPRGVECGFEHVCNYGVSSGNVTP